ncbi:unnamed protein product [Cuscuta epithymum]|uniref:WRKY domain-containing protein n=1 Tax=Cuscuta epithymum TaxID=186058 RepID=A0AAV0DVC7_9ASTE|nr:unnamed protein product [Cuscuta epithymum]
MEDDWDLYAVVRGCAASTASSSSPVSSAAVASTTSPCSFQPRQDQDLLGIQDLFEFGASSSSPSLNDSICSSGWCFNEELHDLYKPFFPPPPPPPPPLPPQASFQQKQRAFSPSQPTPISPLSVLGGLQDLSPTHQIFNSHISSSSAPIILPKKPSFPLNIASTPTLAPSPKGKRRKNQLKRVCQVPAEGLSSDVWSWRKYGQKPIKGSPYPRGYYRCSTSKGCLARKQVERNRSDPNMFIVTYTAEHNHAMPTHRNSLAGSTRQKPPTPYQAETSGDGRNPANTSPASSPAPEKQESSRDEDICEDEDDEYGVSNMASDRVEEAPEDDFFEGLEDLAGDCFPSNLPAAGMQFPWLANKAATTAAGGG